MGGPLSEISSQTLQTPTGLGESPAPAKRAPIEAAGPRVELNFGLSQVSLGNNNPELDKLRGTVKEFRLSPIYFKQGSFSLVPSLSVSHQWLEGNPLAYSPSYKIIPSAEFLGAAFSLDFFFDPTKNIGFLFGMKFGAERADFKDLIVNNNPIKLSLKDTSEAIGARVGVRLPETQLTPFFALGAHAYLELDPSFHSIRFTDHATPVSVLPNPRVSIALGLTGTL